MGRVLVDSNVLLDVMTEDERWLEWSSGVLERHGEEDILCINPVIYAEVSIRFERIEELEAALPGEFIERLPIPYEAAYRSTLVRRSQIVWSSERPCKSAIAILVRILPELYESCIRRLNRSIQ